MSLEEIYFLSQILAAAAIVASLIFVGLEVRQNGVNLHLNTQAMQVSAYHQAIEQVKDAGMQPDLPALIVRARAGDDSFSDTARLRMNILLSAKLFGHEIGMPLAAKKIIDLILWVNGLENNRQFLGEDANISLLKTRPGRLSRRLLGALERPQKHS